MGNNTYVVFDEASKEAALVDPAKGSGPVLVWMQTHGLLPKYVLNTHGHSDHTFDNGLAMDGSDADLMIGEPDEAMLEQLAKGDGWLGKPEMPSPMADAYLEHEQELVLGSTAIRVLHTPGHTPGSSCFVYEDAVLTGDTLFQHSIGRTDFPGGSFPEIVKSIEDPPLHACANDTGASRSHGGLDNHRREAAQPVRRRGGADQSFPATAGLTDAGRVMTTPEQRAGGGDSPQLQALKAAQERVNALRSGLERPPLKNGDSGDEYAQELVTAMNRLMSLIRHATPEDVAAFDEWRNSL